jgi:hypothetical protein
LFQYTIESRLEDICNNIIALPHTIKILTPGHPKRFIAIGISIATMAMSNFNTIRITQLDAKITRLKVKTDQNLHGMHLHHLDEKMEQTQTMLADLQVANIWFSSKVTDVIDNKFQSVIHHHKNMVKLAPPQSRTLCMTF